MVKRLLFLLLLTVPAFAQSPLEKLLPEWWKEASAKAEVVPEERRKPLHRNIVFNQSSGLSKEQRLQELLFAVALRPHGIAGIFLPDEARRFRGVSETTKEDEAAARNFLEQLYRQHAGTDSEAAAQWQSGFAELLLAWGRYEEALELQRQAVAVDDHPYKRILLGVIEKYNGNDEAFAKMIAACPDDPEGISTREQYCWDVARSIVRRTSARDEKARIVRSDILAGRGAATTLPWDDRMHGLVLLARRDRAAAPAELQKVLAAADAPKYVKDDAVYMLIETTEGSSRNPTTLPLIDCFFERRKAAFPPLPEKAWEDLRTLMTAEAKALAPENGDACMQHHAQREEPLDLQSQCVARLLLARTLHGLEDKGAIAKQTAEWAVAISLQSGRPIPLLARILEIAAAGNFNDARAMQYVGSLPRQNGLVEGQITKAVREQTQRVTAPWDSPVSAPSQATNCPR